jgi:hypothetical protein
VLLPPPIVVVLGASLSGGLFGGTAWAPYLDPPATWPDASLPVAVGLGTAPPPGIAQADALAVIDVATRAWMTPACTDARFRLAGARTLVGDGASDGENDVIVHTTDWPTALEPGALAHTIVYVQAGVIVEADVHVNAHDYAFALGDTAGAWDLRSVLTHELGHVLGIGHSTVPRATMNAGLPVGIAARSLEPDDVTAVCTLYPAKVGQTVIDCDRGGPPCPTGFACVGHGCDVPDEPGTLGAPCTSGTGIARRCDGAGDEAECVETTRGERCGVSCATDAGVDAQTCGEGLDCVATQYAGDRECLPTGATPIVPDAGDDASPEGDADAADATTNAPAASSGCSCATGGRREKGAWIGIVAMAGAMLSLRRRRALRR